MQKLKHEPAYYETTKFKWRQRIGFGISDYACNLAYLLAIHTFSFITQTARDLQPALLDLCSL